MQAVLLAAGKSSRFYPYTDFHKSCIKIAGKPIIVETLENIHKTGIREVIIIISRHSPIKHIIGDSSRYGLEISYVEQSEALGMGDAILCAKDIIQDNFFLLHAHHVEFHEYKKNLEQKQRSNDEIVLLAKQTDNPQGYGILKIQDDKVLDIIEKPTRTEAPSNLKVVGIYFLTKKFIKVLSKIPPDHYNFEKALSLYAKQNSVRFFEAESKVLSYKYPWDLLEINKYILSSKNAYIAKTAVISPNATIHGTVIAEDNVTVMDNVTIKGPCFIGEGSYIGNNAIIRDSVSIGKKCVIGANMEIKNSIVMDGATTHSGFIGDSVIGKTSKIAAFFCTANVRLDRKEIKVRVLDKQVATGIKSLGVIIGNNAKVGIRVSTMPGVIIGNNATIGPSTVVSKNIDDDVTYYTSFKEYIEVKDQKVDKTETVSDETNKIVLFDIDHTLFDTEIFKKSKLETFQLYKEVKDVLLELQKVAKLGIFSEGELNLQRNKLFETQIESHFFDEYVNIVEKKEEVLKVVLDKYKNNRLFLVDDKLSILHEAKKYMPNIFTIWIKRGIFADVQKDIEGFEPDAKVLSLEEIVKIIKNN